MNRIVYLDNAATSWPKPEPVYAAVDSFMRRIGASPGRSGHSRSIEAGRIVFETRESIAELFGLNRSEQVAFTQNATHAINLALKGILAKGDHVIVSSMEHNSMMRPLNFLHDTMGIAITTIECSGAGSFPLHAFEQSFREKTKLVAVTHASNVSGTIMPIREMGTICRKKGVLFLVDAAQTAGVIPLDMREDRIDLLAFTGHKSLMGPQGIGGLCLNTDLEIPPLMQGGTGSDSELDVHPGFLPDRLESGTLNTVGVAGLGAGVSYVQEVGIDQIRHREAALTALLIRGLQSIEGIRIHGPCDAAKQIGVVSFSAEGARPCEIGLSLDREFRVMSRVGLHCAPAAHRTLGTFPEGAVRFSLSCLSREDDAVRAVEATKKTISSLRKGR